MFINGWRSEDWLTFDRSLYRNCIFGQAYEEWVRWCHHEDLELMMKKSFDEKRWTYVKPSEEYFLFECCNQKVYDHLKRRGWKTLEWKDWIYLRVVFQQRSNVVDRVESLPYLEFLPWHFRSYPMVRPNQNSLSCIQWTQHTSRVIVLPVRV